MMVFLSMHSNFEKQAKFAFCMNFALCSVLEFTQETHDYAREKLNHCTQTKKCLFRCRAVSTNIHYHNCNRHKTSVCPMFSGSHIFHQENTQIKSNCFLFFLPNEELENVIATSAKRVRALI